MQLQPLALPAGPVPDLREATPWHGGRVPAALPGVGPAVGPAAGPDAADHRERREPGTTLPANDRLSGSHDRGRAEKPALQDYPAMFWLRDGFDHGLRSVFDLGGPAGTRFYAFESWLRCPAETRWTVCDAPAAVAQGRRLALARQCDDMLDFTENPDLADGYDMLFASGSLQRLPWTLDHRLARLKQMPRRLVINAAAMHPQRAFSAPPRSGGSAWRVQAEPVFVSALQALGYRQLDRWETPGEVPRENGSPDHGETGPLDHLTGYCFDRW